MKTRAFVKYTKLGKIIPGSLITTTGGAPDKSSIWKEVPTDVCCDNSKFCMPTGTLITIASTEINESNLINFSAGAKDKLYIAIGCTTNNNVYWSVELNTSTITNIDDLMVFLNSQFLMLGTFTYNNPTPNYYGLILSTNSGSINNLFFNTCVSGTYYITQQNYN